MPKMKSHKGMKKRVKISGTGKVMFKKAGSRHLLTDKTPKRKRTLGQEGSATPAETRIVKKLLPYGGM